jgi:hypothetical protein
MQEVVRVGEDFNILEAFLELVSTMDHRFFEEKEPAEDMPPQEELDKWW